MHASSADIRALPEPAARTVRPPAAPSTCGDDGVRWLRPPAQDDGAAPRADAPDDLLMQVLEEMNQGLMLVSPSGRVRFANHVALRDCAAGPALRLRDGHLRALRPGEHDRLVKALAGALAGRRSLLTFDPCGTPLSLAIVPLRAATPAYCDVAALLVFGKRQLCEPLSIEFFARTYELSRAERCVLEKLCSGVRPPHIARQTGVALTTVRTQVASIRLKTQARSIAEVVRMVTLLPPIVSVLGRFGWGAPDGAGAPSVCAADALA